MMGLDRLSHVLADGDPPAARRVTGLLLNSAVGITAMAVCLTFGASRGRPDLLAAAGAMALAQILVLLVREPVDADWPMLTFLQALMPATATLSLTADQDALVPLLALNLAWAAVMLPTWVASLTTVWNLAALCAPLAAAQLWDDAPSGYSVGEALVGAVAFALVTAVGQALSVSLRSSRARSDMASRTDVLTGLFNRRHTGEALVAETRLAARNDRPCAVLLVDVDHFKRVNDTFGHAAGDEVLVAIARRILARARAGDLATRWGGEEFLLLARDVPDHATLCSLAEDVRLSCRGTVRVAGGTVIPITVSVGAALSIDFPTPPTLTEAADRALYEAKSSGRDRSRVAGTAQMLVET